MTMLYRRFGRTELPMPVFSCGGMRYQQAWQDVSPNQIADDNQKNLEATIRQAWDLGITHIETARGYGSSEMQLGFVLPQFPRAQLICQTKVSPTPEARDFRQDFETSLSLLQLDYVDLFALHGINTREILDWSLRSGGCLDEAYRLKAEGKVKHIGFSTHAPTEVIVEAIASGRFDYVNLHWYYINQTNWPAIAAAKQQDMGVFIISPSDKGGHLYNPPQKLIELCQPLHPMVFNDLFCLSHPEVHTLSLGAARPSDFDRHLEVLALLDQADEILPPILERLEEEAIAILGKTWYQTWDVGLPQESEVPGHINIHTILWLRNLLLAYDMEEFCKARYNLLGRGGHWFAGQQAGEVEQYDLSDCLQQSPYADRIPQLLAETHERLQGKAMQRLSRA